VQILLHDRISDLVREDAGTQAGNKFAHFCFLAQSEYVVLDQQVGLRQCQPFLQYSVVNTA